MMGQLDAKIRESLESQIPFPSRLGKPAEFAAMVTHICRHSSGVLVLDAQTYLVDWYRKLGFTVTGSEFLEDGIPHTPMSRSEA